MTTLDRVCTVLRTSLALGARKLSGETALLGALPELDSMAVVTLLTALEEHFGVTIHDDDLSARHFASVATLTAFIDARLP